MSDQDADHQKIAQAIRAYMARERISREEFVFRTKLGKSTVDKLLTGLFSEKTLIQVEQSVGLSLRSGNRTKAPAVHGGYLREEVQRFIGRYLFIRPCFRGKECLYAFLMEIVWDHEVPALLVRQKEPGELPAQLGHIHIPRSSMHVFIQSNEDGWLKQLILSQPDVRGSMKGVMLTMGDVYANVYMPIAVPVAFIRNEASNSEMIGEFSPTSVHYHDLLAVLSEVEDDEYAKWIKVPQGSRRSS